MPVAIQQIDHQGDATLSYLAAIDDKHQFSDFGQAIEQFLHKRQVIACIIDPLILDSAAIAFDPAICFGPVGGFSGNRRQLATLSHHDPTDQGGQGCQLARQIAFGFSGIQLHNGLSDGTIHSTIGTHVVHSCSSVVGKT